MKHILLAAAAVLIFAAPALAGEGGCSHFSKAKVAKAGETKTKAVAKTTKTGAGKAKKIIASSSVK